TPSYQWMRNGMFVGANSTIYTSSGINDGDDIICQVTPSPGCYSVNKVNSNTIKANVLAMYTPAITITADQNTVCATTLVNFSSTVTEAGLNPVYNWKKNGVSLNENTSTLSISGFNDQDMIS